MINWLKLLAVSENLFHSFSNSEVSLPNPPHWVSITRTSLGERPALWRELYFELMGTYTYWMSWRGGGDLKIWVIHNSFYTSRVVVVTTVSEESASHANWLVIKVSLFSYFVRFWDYFFSHGMREELICDQIARF